MKKTYNCKVLFTTLIQRMWKNKSEDPIVEMPFYDINKLISFILKRKRVDKFFNLKGDKFCFLEYAKTGDLKSHTLIEGFFKSARSEFRPDLINKKTGNERKNPKEITEGDIEKTHFVIKIDKTAQEVYLFLEHNYYGMNINNVINYFSFFNINYLESIGLKRNYSIKHLLIVRNNFLTELETMNRAKIAEIYFDKKLLGRKALNFSDRTVSLKRELKLTAAASAGQSIKEVAVDFYNSMNGHEGEISKVRVYGRDENENDVILDTSFMSRVDFVEVDVNEDTGDINSTQFFTKVKGLIESF